MAFIFIGCDKDDEKVLPEEQEQEPKQDDEEEMQHNGAYVLKFQVLTSENKDYFSITDVPEGSGVLPFLSVRNSRFCFWYSSIIN